MMYNMLKFVIMKIKLSGKRNAGNFMRCNATFHVTSYVTGREYLDDGITVNMLTLVDGQSSTIIAFRWW